VYLALKSYWVSLEVRVEIDAVAAVDEGALGVDEVGGGYYVAVGKVGDRGGNAAEEGHEDGDGCGCGCCDYVDCIAALDSVAVLSVDEWEVGVGEGTVADAAGDGVEDVMEVGVHLGDADDGGCSYGCGEHLGPSKIDGGQRVCCDQSCGEIGRKMGCCSPLLVSS
jgi:hypothetical protein